MIFDEEEGGMIFLLSQRQQKGKVLNTCYWRIYNIMTMAMMMILLHKSCKVFYLLMIMIFIDIIPNIFSCATKINFARLSLLCWLDSWPMHHEAAQLSQFQLLCWLQLLHCSGVGRQMQPRVKISGGI